MAKTVILDYNDPELTRMLDGFSAIGDPEKQETIMRGIQEFVHENVPYIPGFVGHFIYAVNSDLKWEPSSDERVYLHDAEWR